jgi:pyruvate,orthophosphate dikinase
MKKEALKRIDPAKLDELLHPIFDKQKEAQADRLASGLPASPGCRYRSDRLLC